MLAVMHGSIIRRMNNFGMFWADISSTNIAKRGRKIATDTTTSVFKENGTHVADEKIYIFKYFY